MATFKFNVDGKPVSVDADPDMPLLYALRGDLGMTNPHFGCGLAQCGACTVHLNGEAIRSCVMPVSAVAGKKVTTLKGLGTPEKPHPIQKAFIDAQAAQCGFCLNGVILTAKAFLDQNPKANDEQIHQAMSTVLCRCFSTSRMMIAIKKYATERA